ncbi:MAG: LysE/ArgO family amino acid transporter [Pseudomonadota bacterium]
MTGFASGLSLILAIGAQNAFVLRQGLTRTHVLPLVLLCSLSDAILIVAGVAGFAALVDAFPWFPTVMVLGGAAFLIVYGATRLRAAYLGGDSIGTAAGAASLARVLAIGAAFTWLNPHVYLDTLGLMGAISTQYDVGQERLAFAAGGVTASFVFFFSLGFGARALAPVLSSPRAWRWLDTGIGLTMWALAAKLLASLV